MQKNKKTKNDAQRNETFSVTTIQSGECCCNALCANGLKVKIPHAQDNNSIVMPSVTSLALVSLVWRKQKKFRLMSCTDNINMSPEENVVTL